MDNLHQLIGELAADISAAHSDLAGLREAARLARDDGEPLRRLLDNLATDDALAATIARDSYWHSNGFAKLNLYRGHAPESRLRLHVWSDDHLGHPSPDSANIHNHRWEFASVVLAGGLQIDEFEETGLAGPEAVPCRKFAYVTPLGASIGHLRPLGDAALRGTRRMVYRVGEVHWCDVDRLHVVEPLDGGVTATVIFQGPAQADAALVYQRVGRQPVPDTGQALTAAEVMRLAGQTLVAMDTPREWACA